MFSCLEELSEEIKKTSQFAKKLSQDLILPGQEEYIGDHQRTDFDGAPFDFTKVLLEAKQFKLDIWGRIIK